MNKLYYLASPYSLYPGGKQEAFELVCKKAAELMVLGHLVFCPIAHSHPIEQLGMKETHSGDFWLKQDFAILKHCDELLVYMMPGWKQSTGLAAELKFAEFNNIPITFLEFESEQQQEFFFG